LFVMNVVTKQLFAVILVLIIKKTPFS